MNIEVKVAMVDGRQLKTPVFKQIPIEHIVDRNTLRGTPLLRVGYHLGCEWMGKWAKRRSESHIHVLWLKEGELRHAVELLGSNTRGVPPWCELEQLELVYLL